MSGPTLRAAVLSTQHSHRSLSHPQTGNPFFDWWSAGRFRCDLCLAVMRDGGDDIALGFTLALPFRMVYGFDVRWWRDTYLAALRFVDDQSDRDYMRERLADATRRGKIRTQVAS